MYTWWHNKVLEVVMELFRAQCEAANQQPVTAKEPIIQFHKEGECPMRKQKISNMKLLNGASDWNVSVDLKISLQFPVHIIQTEKRPDIVARSNSKSVLIIENWLSRGNKIRRRHMSGRKTDTSHCMPTVWKRVGNAIWFRLKLVVVVF